MPSLWLSLAMSPTAPAIPADAVPLSCQIWRGGRAVGGTLDPSLRGIPDGPTGWCLLADRAAAIPSPAPPEQLLKQINPGDRLSPDGAGALFVVAMDIEPAAEEEFNDWYDTEHIPLLSRVPGVICARRFRAREGAPRYVAIYHLTDAKAYASSPWREADQTPWIGRMRRFQSNRTYYMFYPPPVSHE